MPLNHIQLLKMYTQKYKGKLLEIIRLDFVTLCIAAIVPENPG